MKAAVAILAGACLAGVAAASTVPADEPLDPNVAFRPEARLVAGRSAADAPERNGIDIEYRIAPGYHLYRSRLRFEVSPPTLLIGPPELPPGVELDDPFVGKSRIYRDRVTIHLPFLASLAAPGHYRVKITAQGCAEERLCYAPFAQEVPVSVPGGSRNADFPGPRSIPGLPR